MASRKLNRKYYFSVEGETEQWYLQWLQRLINSNSSAACTVLLDARIEKDPLKRAKQITAPGKMQIWHFSDYESDSEQHRIEFKHVMDQMKKAMDAKNLTYRFGYSNLTFDLWIILHKQDCYGSLADRNQYLRHINQAYGTSFLDMTEYKHEDNFKDCLSQLNLRNVIDAIERAKVIARRNRENGYTLQRYRQYGYYRENPSLDVWIAIEKILKDCKLLRN